MISTYRRLIQLESFIEGYSMQNTFNMASYDTTCTLTALEGLRTAEGLCLPDGVPILAGFTAETISHYARRWSEGFNARYHGEEWWYFKGTVGYDLLESQNDYAGGLFLSGPGTLTPDEPTTGSISGPSPFEAALLSSLKRYDETFPALSKDLQPRPIFKVSAPPERCVQNTDASVSL